MFICCWLISWICNDAFSALSCIQLVQNPGVSIVGYSQPDRFFQPYKKLKERRDGLVVWMLIYQPIPRRLTSAETKEFIGRLNQFPLKYDHLLKNHFVKQKAHTTVWYRLWHLHQIWLHFPLIDIHEINENVNWNGMQGFSVRFLFINLTIQQFNVLLTVS